MPVGPLVAPALTTSTAVQTAVISTAPRTRLSYLSMVNNDASTRWIAIWDATAYSAALQPKYVLGPVAAGATYVATNQDLGGAGRLLELGLVVGIVTSQPVAGGTGANNVGTCPLGTSGTFVTWSETAA